MSVTARPEWITPTEAQALLDRNSGNRTVRWATVRRYADDMAHGRWLMTGESIIVDRDGCLRNGQHRLLACVLADTPIETVIVRGVEPGAFVQMDSGNKRTAADVLQISGHRFYAVIAAAAKLAIGYDAGVIANTQAAMTLASRSAIQAEASGDRSSRYEHMAEMESDHRGRGASSGIVPSAMVAFGVLAVDAWPIDDVCAWIGNLQTGENLNAGDPRLALRRWVVTARSRRRDNRENLAAVIQAWNAEVAGESRQTIKGWAKGTPFPAISAPK